MKRHPTIESIWRTARTIEQLPYKPAPVRVTGRPQWLAALGFMILVILGSVCVGMVLMYALFGR